MASFSDTVSMDETIRVSSYIGKRLKKYKREGKLFLMWEGKKISLVQKISIGRDKDNDIQIMDSLASRHHAIIQKMKEIYYIHDFGSTNGTYVNGERIPAKMYVRLNQGDVITIGKNDLTIR